MGHIMSRHIMLFGKPNLYTTTTTQRGWCIEFIVSIVVQSKSQNHFQEVVVYRTLFPIICRTVSYHALRCCASWSGVCKHACCAMLCCAPLCHVVIWYITLRYLMLCYHKHIDTPLKTDHPERPTIALGWSL